MMAPAAYKFFPLKSASVMDDSIVTGWLSYPLPSNVNFANAPLAKR